MRKLIIRFRSIVMISELHSLLPLTTFNIFAVAKNSRDKKEILLQCGGSGCYTRTISVARKEEYTI